MATVLKIGVGSPGTYCVQMLTQQVGGSNYNGATGFVQASCYTTTVEAGTDIITIVFNDVSILIPVVRVFRNSVVSGQYTDVLNVPVCGGTTTTATPTTTTSTTTTYTTTTSTKTTTLQQSDVLLSCSALDNFFNQNSSVYDNNYSTIVYKNNNTYWKKSSGIYFEDSVLSIMSCTKTMTAVVIFKLKELGLLDLNTPISTYLPNYAGYGNKGNITLRMLLGHTSGIPADTSYEQDSNSTVQNAANLIGQNVSLLFTPGTSINYSSAGYQVAAAVAEVVSNKSLKQLLVDYIFAPLNIVNYRWTQTPILGSGDNTANNPIAGYGLSTSAKEYIKFVKSLAGHGVQLISQASKTLMFSDATNGIDGYFGYGILRRDVTGGSPVIDLHIKGASGCYGFINTDTNYCGVVWNSSQIQNTDPTNEIFSQVVSSNLGSCGNTNTTTSTTTTNGAIIPDNQKAFIFVVNLTGNGFDFEGAQNNYISDDKIQIIQEALTGVNADAVDAIRMPFIWGNYNPSQGVYKNNNMSVAINWVKSLRPSKPVLIDLLVVPVFGHNDNRIPMNQRIVDNDGNHQDCTYNGHTVPSYYSTAMTNVLNEGFDNLMPHLVANHNNDIRVIEFGAGQSEEHYLPFTANNPVSGGMCGQVFSGIGDYSQGASRPAWRTFLNSYYGSGNLPYLINGVQYTAGNAELPNVGVTPGNNYNMNYSQPAYRDLFRFYAKGIFDVWKRFHDKVKQWSNFKTGFVIPDMLNEQGQRWIFHGGAIFLGMKYADQFYHSYNIDTNQWKANLWGTDTLLGTFPNQGKLSAIEFDSFDIGGGSPNNVHVKNVILRFLKNGGKVVHSALPKVSEIQDWKNLVTDIKSNYINNNSWQLENRSNAPVVNVDTSQLFDNPYIYEQAWTSVGGNNSTSGSNIAYNAIPVNIVITNNGTVDNFFLGN